MSDTYYVEYYDADDTLLDCSDEVDTLKEALSLADKSHLTFEVATIIKKSIVGEMNWKLHYDGKSSK